MTEPDDEPHLLGLEGDVEPQHQRIEKAGEVRCDIEQANREQSGRL